MAIVEAVLVVVVVAVLGATDFPSRMALNDSTNCSMRAVAFVSTMVGVADDVGLVMDVGAGIEGKGPGIPLVSAKDDA